ncbi:MAG: hypothetical protein WCG26_04700 [Chloroflexales bacterium]
MRLLIVENAIRIARDLATTGERFAHVVVGMARSGTEALAVVPHPDVARRDIRLAGPRDGLATAHPRAATRHIPLISRSTPTDGATLERAAASEPFSDLRTPFSAQTRQRTPRNCGGAAHPVWRGR